MSRQRTQSESRQGLAVKSTENDYLQNLIRQYGSELGPPGSARTVRVRDSRAIVTDGPFAETKEQIAGFDVLECADLDEAIEVASSHPMARLGILELRPFWPLKEK